MSRPLVVHLSNGETRTLDISQAAEKRYWFSMCPMTSKMGKLLLCGGCRTVGYIGKDEQKQDWGRHKELCKAITKIRGDHDHWLGACQRPADFQEQLQRILGRPLTQFEQDIGEHPRICIVCRQGSDQKVLRTCQSCFCVAFCLSHLEEAMEAHSKWCQHLRLCAEDYKNEQTLGHQVQGFAPESAKTFSSLKKVANISDLFKEQIAVLVSNKLEGYQDSELRFLTFLYTCPLTVLYGLEHADIEVQDRRSLTIHLVGVRRAELRHLVGWEIIASRLPKLQRLKLVFIGDEAVHKDLPKEFSYKSKNLQRRKDLSIVYSMVPPMLYQDFTGNESPPDAIAALDCGFKFYPSWRPAIKSMLAFKQCPLIFTEFNLADQEDNLSLVRATAEGQQKALDVCLAPSANPFRGGKPSRCSDKTGNYEPFSVVFTNDFICVVKSS